MPIKVFFNRHFFQLLLIAGCLIAESQTGYALAQFPTTDGFISENDKHEESKNGRWLFYEIRKDGALLGYLFGGSHTVVLNVDALPAKIKRALEQSNILVFESNYFDHALLNEARKQLTSNPGGKSLDSILLPKTIATLKKVYDYEKIPLETQNLMNMWNPYLVTLQLDNICAKTKSEGVLPEGILYNFALKRNKKILGLENIDDQIGWAKRLSMQEWDDYISANSKWIMDVHCQEKFYSSYKKISSDIVNGNADAVYTEYMRFNSEDIPAMWLQEKYLLIARNKPIYEKMIRLMGTDAMPFFSIGSAHLGGKQGVISLLKSNSFEVIQR